MKILKWFIESSANPANLSLTIKGLLPLLILMGIDSSLLDGASDSIVSIIVLIGQIITAVITLIGFVRKIVNSF